MGGGPRVPFPQPVHGSSVGGGWYNNKPVNWERYFLIAVGSTMFGGFLIFNVSKNAEVKKKKKIIFHA